MFSVVVANSIELGPGCVIDPLTLIFRPQVFRMGERSRIASFVRIIGWQGEILLAPQTFIAMACLIDTTGDVVVGARSQIGPRSILYTHGATGLIHNMRYPRRMGAIRIGEDVWIGMQTTIPPCVSIGNGVIVFPGLVVRQNIPDNKAVVPPSSEYRLLPTGRLLFEVTDEVRRQSVEQLFAELANHYKFHDVRREGDIWTMATRAGRRLYLVRFPSARLNVENLPRHQVVVWALCSQMRIPGVPTFCFPQLTVFGPHTPFAEQVANYLCVKCGAHFVFSDEQA